MKRMFIQVRFIVRKTNISTMINTVGKKYLFDYKSVLTHFMETKAQIIKLPLNETQKQFFSHSGIDNPQTMIIKVDQTGCQLIGVE